MKQKKKISEEIFSLLPVGMTQDAPMQYIMLSRLSGNKDQVNANKSGGFRGDSHSPLKEPRKNVSILVLQFFGDVRHF